MVRDILTKAGFVENKTFKETRFLKAPDSTYAVYMDSYISRGADSLNLIKEHGYTIEVYSKRADAEAEKRIETALDELGIEFEKQARYWIDQEQLYQVVYEFDYIEK